MNYQLNDLNKFEIYWLLNLLSYKDIENKYSCLNQKIYTNKLKNFK